MNSNAMEHDDFSATSVLCLTALAACVGGLGAAVGCTVSKGIRASGIE
jgi:hypothetical protein